MFTNWHSYIVFFRLIENEKLSLVWYYRTGLLYFMQKTRFYKKRKVHLRIKSF